MGNLGGKRGASDAGDKPPSGRQVQMGQLFRNLQNYTDQIPLHDKKQAMQNLAKVKDISIFAQLIIDKGEGISDAELDLFHYSARSGELKSSPKKGDFENHQKELAKTLTTGARSRALMTQAQLNSIGLGAFGGGLEAIDEMPDIAVNAIGLGATGLLQSSDPKIVSATQELQQNTIDYQKNPEEELLGEIETGAQALENDLSNMADMYQTGQEGE